MTVADMASIMCAQNLWRALLDPKEKRSKPTSARIEEPVFQNVIVGPWAATLAGFDGQDLVICSGWDHASACAATFQTRCRLLWKTLAHRRVRSRWKRPSWKRCRS
ncbi:MAG: hypothetical protein DMF91_21770 [Acidobacteria bacterium]|nr:MAG: hypothetical protein DMF91_21770 [Acidobacteriota bacterium]